MPTAVLKRVALAYTTIAETIALVLGQIADSSRICATGWGVIGTDPIGNHLFSEFAHHHFIKLDVLLSSTVALILATQWQILLLRCAAVHHLLFLHDKIWVILVCIRGLWGVCLQLLRQYLGGIWLLLEYDALGSYWSLLSTFPSLCRQWLLLNPFCSAFRRIFQLYQIARATTTIGLLAVRVVRRFGHLGLWDLICVEGNSLIRDAYHVGKGLLLLSVVLGRIGRASIDDIRLHVGLHLWLLGGRRSILHRCWFVFKDAIGVLALYPSRGGACLPDFIVFLHDCCLVWCLFSVLGLLLSRSCDIRDRSLSSWLPLLNTSLLFFHCSVGCLWLVNIWGVLLESLSAVCQTNSLSLVEQVMIN